MKSLMKLISKKGVREKLVNDKEKAYLSLDLGTIRTDAPIDKMLLHMLYPVGIRPLPLPNLQGLSSSALLTNSA